MESSAGGGAADSAAGDAGLAASGLVLLTIGWRATRGGDGPLAWERSVFRWFNEWPDRAATILRPAAWIGTLLGPLAVAAALVARTRRADRPVSVLVAGAGGWLLARLVKLVVDRGRPTTLVADAAVRAQQGTGAGFVSGHTTVAFAIAPVIAPALPRGPRALVYATAGLVGVTRMVDGRHLPADVIGAAGLGLVSAGVTRAAGRRRRSGAPRPGPQR